ncbi:ABC transporter substrate-binding protein [Nocardioides luteus]|uniref:ABC transporter substrate-binding protein n=1 Tax=Nocardioides luteus TaxID=1844 RepID=UPI000A0145F0|nr:ABC transporter substrate-binding protein [Nocardioides luteus]
MSDDTKTEPDSKTEPDTTTHTTAEKPATPEIPPRRRTPLIVAAVAVVAVIAIVAAFLITRGSDDESGTESGGGTTSVRIGEVAGDAAKPTTIEVPVVEEIRKKVPQEILDRGTLKIGQGALPAGFPPLAFVGTDNKTLTGTEPDLGRLIAAVLGLKPELDNATWENLFVGLDAGTSDVAISNVTDTEERKQKYDFASYRQDNLGFATVGSSTWEFGGDYRTLDGLQVAVGSGTNQEKILLEWQAKLKAEGKKLDVKYFPDNSATWTALESGQIDAYFGPNPGIAYQIAGTGDTFRNAGTFSGAGASLQGLIAATTKKDSGLVEALADAINYLIEHGQYATWLKTYGLSNEAVEKSEINPPGLPLENQ